MVEGCPLSMRGQVVRRWKMLQGGLEGVGEQQAAEQAIRGLDEARLTRPLKRLQQAGARAGGLHSQTLIKMEETCEQSCFPVCIMNGVKVSTEHLPE